MTYQSILTSKGTTTIPVAIRKELGIKPGMSVSFSRNKIGEYVINPVITIEELRELNKLAMKKAGTSHIKTKSGDGFTLAVLEKYGQQ